MLLFPPTTIFNPGPFALLASSLKPPLSFLISSSSNYSISSVPLSLTLTWLVFFPLSSPFPFSFPPPSLPHSTYSFAPPSPFLFLAPFPFPPSHSLLIAYFFPHPLFLPSLSYSNSCSLYLLPFPFPLMTNIVHICTEEPWRFDYLNIELFYKTIWIHSRGFKVL